MSKLSTFTHPLYAKGLDLVNDLTEEMSELATASDIHLTSQVPAMEVYVLGNESQLYRLVSNLIANAIQYSLAQGSVHISLEVHEHNAIIAVKDTGIGIPKAEQHRIFDRFYRVDGGGLAKAAYYLFSKIFLSLILP